jgi:hypothetical protein
MTTESHSNQVMSGRLDILESQNRRLKRVVFALPLIGIAVVGLTAADSGKGAKDNTITTQKLILVDEKGKTTASLTTEKDGPHFVLFDRAGRTRLRITANTDEKGPAVFLVDTKNAAKATLRIVENGDGFLELRGDERDGYAKMGFHDGNRAPLIELGREGKIVWGKGENSFID